MMTFLMSRICHKLIHRLRTLYYCRDSIIVSISMIICLMSRNRSETYQMMKVSIVRKNTNFGEQVQFTVNYKDSLRYLYFCYCS